MITEVKESHLRAVGKTMNLVLLQVSASQALTTLIIGLILAIVGYFLGGLRQNKNRKSDEVLRKEALAIEAVKERDHRIDELEKGQAELKAQLAAQNRAAIPIQAAMEAMLIAKLTNAHTPEADALLKKQTDGTLTAEDAAKFTEAMLQRETDAGVSEQQRIAARILPDIIRLRELAEETPDAEVKTLLVTVPKTETVASRDGGTQQEEKGN